MQNCTVPVQHETRTNDLTFAQLTRTLFPALKVVRVLNRTLLSGLERRNGPEDEAYARWERWEAQCKEEGVRLEDCTGALLGDLPLDSEDEWWDIEESEDEFEEDGEEQEKQEQKQEAEEKKPDDELRPSNVKELRDLLDEIRRMTETTPFLSEEGFAALL